MSACSSKIHLDLFILIVIFIWHILNKCVRSNLIYYRTTSRSRFGTSLGVRNNNFGIAKYNFIYSNIKYLLDEKMLQGIIFINTKFIILYLYNSSVSNLLLCTTWRSSKTGAKRRGIFIKQILTYWPIYVFFQSVQNSNYPAVYNMNFFSIINSLFGDPFFLGWETENLSEIQICPIQLMRRQLQLSFNSFF